MRSPRTFTLIELILVVSVLVVLFSLINPVLKNTITKSHNLSCKNNLKQIGLVVSTYTDNWNGRFPPNVDGWGPNAWLNKLVRIALDPNAKRTEFDPRGTFFSCPSVDKEDTSLRDYMKGGYGYNGYAGYIHKPPRKPIYTDATRFVTDVSHPSETALIGDDKTKNFDGPAYKHCNLLSANQADDHPRDRHDLAANYYWVDGHVEEMTQIEFIADGEAKGRSDYYLEIVKFED